MNYVLATSQSASDKVFPRLVWAVCDVVGNPISAFLILQPPILTSISLRRPRYGLIVAQQRVLYLISETAQLKTTKRNQTESDTWDRGTPLRLAITTHEQFRALHQHVLALQDPGHSKGKQGGSPRGTLHSPRSGRTNGDEYKEVYIEDLQERCWA